MQGYSAEQLERALCLAWELLEEKVNDTDLEELVKGNPILEHLHEFGVRGPLGMGLGRYGGHAVD